MSNLAEIDKIIEDLNNAETEIMVETTKTHRPAYAETSLAQRGAMVISVDGESISDGATINGIGFLGYLIEITSSHAPEWVRVRFTIPTEQALRKLKSRRTTIEEIKDLEHPLSLSGSDAINPHGFLVKKKDGIRVMERGNLVLVSRTGIFAGENGWKVAKEWQEKYRDLLYELYAIQEAYEDSITERDRLENELREIQNEIADLREKEIWYQDRLTKAQAEVEDVQRILTTYKAKLPALAKENQTWMTEWENILEDVSNRLTKLTTTVLKLESTAHAYMVQSQLPQDIIESAIKQEKERLRDAEIIGGEEGEESEEGDEESGGSGEGTGRSGDGTQEYGKQTGEGRQGDNSSALPSSRNGGYLKTAEEKIKRLARLDEDKGDAEGNEEESG